MRSIKARHLLAVLSLLPALGTAGVSDIGGKPNKRSISDFVDRQGTFCISNDFSEYGYTDTGTRDGECPTSSELLFTPPVKNFAGHNNSDGTVGSSVDYAGLVNDVLGTLDTTFEGKIREWLLPDGRARVKVKLKTENAFAYAVAGRDYANDELLFGYRVTDVQAGSDYALGESKLVVEFINSAPGAALPDLIQLFFFPEPGQEVIFYRFAAEAEGPIPYTDYEGELKVNQICPAPCSENGFEFSKEIVRIKQDD